MILLGIYFSVPNFFGKDADGNDRHVAGFVNSQVTLGLDLQGGSQLLLQVDTDKVVSDRIENLRKDVRTALRGRREDGQSRITFSPPSIDGDTITVQIKDPAQSKEAENRLKQLIQPVGGFGSGIRNIELRKKDDTTFTLQITEDAKNFYASTAVVDSIEAIRERIDGLGTTEPIIQRQGVDRLLVQVPGDPDSERLKNVINAEGQLSFHLVDSTLSPVDVMASPLVNRRVLPNTDQGYDMVIIDPPEVTGDMITDASSSLNPDGNGTFQVNISFDKKGQRRFFETTKNRRGQLFAIVLDDEIISSPQINDPINAPSMRIIGSFEAQEAADLALLIRSGALPAPLQVVEQRTVGPELGADSVKAGTTALIVGFIGVMIFMLITYGRFGVYANIALLSNVVLIAGTLSLLGATLTLPGIAGIVLTIGMAVDANVLIFERIREELAAGKGAVTATELGYQKAWSAIFDANITTFIAAAIMFSLGSGPVKGFSVTLAIGVITSMFTAYILTRLLAGRYVLRNRPKTLSI